MADAVSFNRERLMLTFRSETPSDWETIRELIDSAFTESEHGHHGEAELVDRLRSNCDDFFSFVACIDNQIIGNVVFTPVVLGVEPGQVAGLGMAPVAVATSHQRQGIGAQLIEHGLSRLPDSRWRFVAVIGSPDYYSRFGFENRTADGILHGFDGLPQACLLIRMLHARKDDELPSGTLLYRDEFGPQ